jgi:indole-3-glycerol phosphate synthase
MLELNDTSPAVEKTQIQMLRKAAIAQRFARASSLNGGDVIGVMKVQFDKLNVKYLSSWAKKLGLNALLEKALKEAQIDRNNGDF